MHVCISGFTINIYIYIYLGLYISIKYEQYTVYSFLFWGKSDFAAFLSPLWPSFDGGKGKGGKRKRGGGG